MSSSHYAVIVDGLKGGCRFTQVVNRLSTVLGTDKTQVRKIFKDRPTVVKKGLDRPTARKYQAAFERLGVLCHVEAEADKNGVPHTAASSGNPRKTATPSCPKCGYTSADRPDELLLHGECPVCGIVVAKYLATAGKRTQEKSTLSTARQRSFDRPKKSAATQAAVSLLVFGFICLLSAFVFDISYGNTIYETLPARGGTVGPINVQRHRGIYKIHVSQKIVRDKDWSYVTGEVLDADKNYLFGFGQEFWKESGYDSEGSWTERKTDYAAKVTLAKGTYYLNFESERSPRVNRDIHVAVHAKRGSSLPLLIAGIGAVLLGIVLNEITNRSFSNMLNAVEAD